MKNSTRFLWILGLFTAGGVAHAEGGKGASLTLNFSVLNYSMNSKSDTPDGGTKTSSKETKLDTAKVGGAYAQFTLGNFNVYLNPFGDDKKVSPSFMVIPDFLEVGLDIGLNSTSVDKPAKMSTNDTTLGLFAWVYPKLGSMTSEIGLVIDQVSNKESDESSGTAVKKESSNMTEMVAANIVVPLAKNFNYVGGLSYTNGAGTVKEPATSKGKNTSGEFGLNLVSLRYTID